MLEILCGMLYRYHVKLVIFVAGSYMQVKFLLLIALAMLFSFIIVVNWLFHACVTSTKQAPGLMHSALSKFSSCCFEGNTSG